MNLIFKRIPNWRGEDDRAWVLYRIESIFNGKEIGHITVEFIPKDNFYKVYKDVTVFLDKIRGNVDIVWHIHNKLYSWHEASAWAEAIRKMSDEQRAFLFKRVKKQAYKLYQKDFYEFKHYHMDFPFVSFIYVDSDFRRQGIGTQLYIEAGRWMRELGLRLHSSTLQSLEATNTWQHMCKAGIAESFKRKEDRGRTRFVIKDSYYETTLSNCA